MGLSFMKSCYGKVDEGQYVSVNPDPTRFQIIKIHQGANTFVEVRYPNCSTFEGVKILVYKGRREGDILKAASLDPHFQKDGQLVPIARFEPTEIGRQLAMELANKELPV